MTAISRAVALAVLAFLMLSGSCRPVQPGTDLINGSFEQPLNTGWRMANGGDPSSATIERRRDLGQPDTGWAVRVAQEGQGHARLVQTVSISDEAYAFGFTARLSISGSLSCIPIAAVLLRYLDEAGDGLGSTRWYRAAPDCDWTGSDTCHLIPVAQNAPWTGYQLNLPDELAAHLPGVAAGRVRRVAVELAAFVMASG
jgi:hypothetical protein